jgi:hypothetical protein
MPRGERTADGVFPAGALIAGKYRIEHVVGQSGMGTVYAAQHETLRQRVALKVLRDQAMVEATTVERFLNEARAASRIQNEHVARVMDAGQTDDGRGGRPSARHEFDGPRSAVERCCVHRRRTRKARGRSGRRWRRRRGLGPRDGVRAEGAFAQEPAAERLWIRDLVYELGLRAGCRRSLDGPDRQHDLYGGVHRRWRAPGGRRLALPDVAARFSGACGHTRRAERGAQSR